MKPATYSLILLICFFAAGCKPTKKVVTTNETSDSVESSVGPIWFFDRREESGVSFQYQSGHEDLYVFPEIMGGGVALFDMDSDGDLDMYFVQGGKLGEVKPTVTNELFRNEGNGKFVNVTTGSGADHAGYGMGVAAGDVDNDGDVDLYVTNVGPNVLLLNDGQGKFTEATTRSPIGDDAWSTSAAFVDIDTDGDLDLYVCNYIAWQAENDLRCSNRAGQPDYCNPTSYNAPLPDSLYLNNGDGTYQDVSAAAGLRTSFGNGLGVVCGDYDGDGLIDIFVANDGTNNQYWINRGNGKFEDMALLTGCAVDKNGKAKAGMGTCAADIDNDLDLDLLVVNLQAQSDSFFRNEGTFFIDETPKVGLGTVTRTFTRFGVGWCDFDNDGALDLFQANGRVTLPDDPDRFEDPFAEPNLLLAGQGARFRSLPDAIPTTVRTSRGAGFGDLDNDGDIDVVVVNRDAQVEILINDHGSSAGNWLMLRCLDEAGRDDVNARVEFDVAGRKFRRDVCPHYSYHASNDARVHLGLGSAKSVSKVTVYWSDGTEQDAGPFEANQFITIEKN